MAINTDISIKIKINNSRFRIPQQIEIPHNMISDSMLYLYLFLFNAFGR